MSILKYKDPKTGEFKRINPYKADLSFVGKDGIVVNKAPNSEEVEISGSGLVQKLTSGGATLVYAKYSNGRDGSIVVNENYTGAQTLPTRNRNGELIAETSAKAVDKTLTNKKYVADNYVEKVKFTNLEQALYGYILDTNEETYADLDSAVLKNSVAVGDNVYPIADNTRALVTRIEGETTKMVQLFDKSVIPATKTVNGITYTNNNDGSITINGTATAESYIIIVVRDKITNGNKILYGSEQNTSDYGVAWGTNLGSSKFITMTIYNNYTVKVNSGVTVDNVKIYPQLFDLTAMGREDITTVEQFKAEFPDIYPYENGNIYPAKISGVKFYEKQDKSGEQASVTLPKTYNLHGIGDYKDYLEITKNEDNELYTLKKVQNVEVNESEKTITPLATPVETVIATNSTYEQVTAIRHNGGLIEVAGNTNKGYARPTIKNTVVYRLTATNTAEG